MGGLDDLLGVGEAFAVFLQLLLLIGGELRGGDLIQLIVEDVLLTQGFFLAAAQFAQLFAHGEVLLVHAAVFFQQIPVPRELIHQADVARRFEQGKVFGLAVDVHEQGAELLHHRDADGAAVDAGGASASVADLTGED